MKTDRIDYSPGPAAFSALEDMRSKFPDLSAQALLDRLVITAASALNHQHWQPPSFYGTDRTKWTKPRSGNAPAKAG